MAGAAVMWWDRGGVLVGVVAGLLLVDPTRPDVWWVGPAFAVCTGTIGGLSVYVGRGYVRSRQMRRCRRGKEQG